MIMFLNLEKKMETINNELAGDFEPKVAIIVYENEIAAINKYYLEARDIRKGNIGPGKPLKIKTIQNIVASLTVEAKANMVSNGLIPNNLLYVNTTPGKWNMIWYLKPSKRYLIMTDKFVLKTGFYHLPGLLMNLKDDTFYVYALQKNRKPTINTELFINPLPNTYPDCKICMGNVKSNHNDLSVQGIMNHWEKLYFASEFSSHLSGNYKKCAKLMRSCIKNPFPVEELIKVRNNLKLGDLL